MKLSNSFLSLPVIYLLTLVFFIANSCKTADETVAVTSVSLEPTTASIVAGNTQQLTATILPSNATVRDYKWKSSDESIATVSNTGLVTAIAAGNATITVTTTDGGKTATCAISVTLNMTPDIFVAGYEDKGNGSDHIAKYWKNGVASNLTDGSKRLRSFNLCIRE